jgi:hypothetical protein
VVGADQPLLEISNSSIGKWDSRLRAFAKLGSKRLSTGEMFEPGFRETLETLEAIRIDGRAGRDVLMEEGDDGLGLEIGDYFHSDAPRGPATLFHRDQDQGRTSPLELSASAETGLLAANPRFINFYLAVQRLPTYLDHGPAKLVKHHPGGLVTGQTKLPLYEQGRHTALVGGHQIGGPEPMSQRDPGPVKNSPGCQRGLLTASGALPPSLIHQFVRSPMSASGADEAIGPAAGRQVVLAGFLGGELDLKLPQRFGKRLSGTPQHYVLGLAESTG